MFAGPHSKLKSSIRAALGAAALVLSAVAVLAQGANPQAAPPPVQALPPAEAAPPPQRLPTPQEVVGAIGRFIDRSIASVGAGAGEALGGATSAAGDIAKGAADAAGAVARLPLSNFVSGMERCAPAPNGAPDCVSASNALCRSKGFQEGRSVDITSARKCSAQAWLHGRVHSDSECVNESFVARAICR